jgi:hypothetical protein
MWQGEYIKSSSRIKSKIQGIKGGDGDADGNILGLEDHRIQQMQGEEWNDEPALTSF